MATQWIVLFDTQGVDTLLPWDDLKADEMLQTLAGEKSSKNLMSISMIILRAQANPQRWPEVWAYETAEDYTYDQMLDLWMTTPQPLANLVREKGTCLFKHARQKEVIV